MVVEPGDRAVAVPSALMLITPGLAEVQLTRELTSLEVPFDRSPVATNCRVAPTLMVGSTGASVTDSRVTTVRLALPVTSPALEVAVTRTEGPALTAVAPPAALTVATAGLEVPQATWSVRFCEAPVVRVPVAVNCWVVPTMLTALAGVTVMDSTAALFS